MAVAKSGSLAVGVALTVTVDVEPFGSGSGFAVTNRSDFGTIWVRLDGEEAEVEGDDCFPVLGTRSFQGDPGNKTVTISMIGDDDQILYTVEGRG